MAAELAVQIPPAAAFFSDSPCSAHYFTAPSTPHRSATTAPTSPSRSAHLDFDAPISSPSAVPFHWEQSPGIPKSPGTPTAEDFEFNFSGQDKSSLSADELFLGGKIKPLKPPPGFHVDFKLSPYEIDPFEAALVKETESFPRATVKSKSPVTKSLTSPASFLSAISFSRKWRLKDLLFRSASEGRAREKDDEVDGGGIGSSFRSSESGMDYRANGFGSETLKKKTFLAYKPGLLGCLGINPNGMHEISR